MASKNGNDNGSGITFEAALLLIGIVTYAFLFLYKSAIAPYSIAVNLVYELIIGVGIIFLLAIILSIYGKFEDNKDASKEIINVIRLFGYPVIIIVMLNSIGVNVTSLLVGAGFLGVIVGLAAQTTLGNLFAGFSILYTRPFRVGEKISVSTPEYSVQGPSYPHEKLEVEVTGTVKSIGIMHTRLLRNDLTMVYIPNSIINVGLITNYSRAMERTIVLRSEVSRGMDIARIKKRIAKEFKGAKFSKIKNLKISTANVSTKTDVGIIVTGRVMQTDYEVLRELMAEHLVTALRSLDKKS